METAHFAKQSRDDFKKAVEDGFDRFEELLEEQKKWPTGADPAGRFFCSSGC